MKYCNYSNLFIGLALISFVCLSCESAKETSRVLVFSKTEGYRHIKAIEAGKKALLRIGNEEGIPVDTTEDATMFTDVKLKQYRAVVFLNVSGDVFNRQQQVAFQRYIQAGGGFLGIHGPTDAERNWPWYGKLIGAYFESHPSNPNVQEGRFIVVDSTHSATQGLPQQWTRTDEFYNFQNIYPGINTLLTIDEESYEGGTMGEDHPMTWYHEFDGGRSFYTAMGHTEETYSEPEFLELIKGGLHYVMGGNDPITLDYSRVKPEENRFSKQVLVQGLNEPMQMDFAPDGRIFIAERRGDIKVYDPEKDRIQVIGTIPTMSRYEDGLLGIALDPDFNQNRWLYIFYTSSDGKGFRLSRFTFDKNGKLKSNSGITLLNIPKEILDGSHTGGGLTFNKKTGNLYVTVGDNTSPRATGFAPLDERQERKEFNAARSSGNTNDLRGKILRIHPEEDGTYSTPDGNLFFPSTPNTRPEIYIMGNRQPWRLSIDSKTGWIYWGEVGPDARVDSTERGPMGYDEFNQAKGPGNYGWPYILGPNRPYWEYDFATGQSGEQYDSDGPVNNSRYNTGKKKLPPAEPSLIWYPYDESKEFPLMGSGGRSAVGGPVFRQADFQNNTDGVFPGYYDGKWFITEWLRGWIHVVSLDEEGKFEWMERFMPDESFNGPMDMKFGPDGSLYVLAYGKGWFKANEEAGIIRIGYNGGNRAPQVKISADKQAGSLPLNVYFSSKGSIDFDQDELYYKWEVYSTGGELVSSSKEANPMFTFENPGVYSARLTITDVEGASSSDSLEIIAGNEPPSVDIEITEGNSSFFFPDRPFQYTVKVKDKEDGSLAEGSIHDSLVTVHIDYLSDGYDSSLMSGGDEFNRVLDLRAPMMINASDCYSCHELEGESIGPSFEEIADRYETKEQTISMLVDKTINGGAGNWGEVAMSAHPALSEEDAQLMIQYILSLDETDIDANESSYPLNGTFTPDDQSEENAGGAYVIRAFYTDKGFEELPPITSGDELVLKAPIISPKIADKSKGFMKVPIANSDNILYLLHGDGSYLEYQDLDLKEISHINVKALPSLGGILEIRADSPNGELLGTSEAQDLKRQSEASSYRIEIEPIEGKRDLYVVARNESAKYHQILLSIESLEFRYSDN